MRQYTSSSQIYRFILILLLISLFGCSSTYPVRTVGKGKGGFELTLGGPMMKKLGPALPIPNFFIGGRYGVLNDLDISVLYNITTPVVPGIALDLITSAHWIPIQPGLRNQADNSEKGWGAGGALHLQWITDFDHGFMIFPTLELLAGYRLRWFNPYLGLNLGLNFYRPDDSDGVLQLHPVIGTEFIIRDRIGLALKCTFYDVTHNLYGEQFDWIMLVNDIEEEKKYGVLGLSIGLSYDFGKRNRDRSTRSKRLKNDK